MTNQNIFTYADMSPSDASNILVAVSALGVKKEKFLGNLVSVVEHHLKSLTNVDLINMAKSSKYLSQFEEYKELYTRVHSEAVQRLTLFQPWERQALTEIYTSHGVLYDSPFVTTKMAKDE